MHVSISLFPFNCPIVIAKPPEGVSTGFVYTNLRIDELNHPDIDAQIEAIENEDIKGIASTMGNVLETVTIPALPIIDDIKNIITEREKARAEKNWAESDRLRDELAEKNIAVKDTSDGSVWEYLS